MKTKTEQKPSDATNGRDARDCLPRLVRSWGNTDYAIIARLTPPYDLVAHPNGPAITNGDWFSVIDIHPDDSDKEKAIKREAQEKWRIFSWPLIKSKFFPPNKQFDESAQMPTDTSDNNKH